MQPSFTSFAGRRRPAPARAPRPSRRRVVALALVGGVLAGVATPAATAAEGATTDRVSAQENAVCRLGWTQTAAPRFGPGGGLLSGIDARDASDAWAVGALANVNTRKENAAAVRWDGSSWNRVRTPRRGIAESLSDVDTFGRRSAWAVGSYQRLDPETRRVDLRTHVLRWNGSKWSVVSSPNAGATPNGGLEGVAHVGSNRAFAVGWSGDPNPRSLILRWNGSSWSRMKHPQVQQPEVYLHAVDGSGPNDVWAVGYTNDPKGLRRTLAMHYDGRAWRVVRTPNPSSTDNVLEDVVVVGPTEAWAVGWSANGPITMRWDGTRWTRLRENETGKGDTHFGVDATRSERIMIAGRALVPSENGRKVTGMVQRWNGSSWSTSRQGRLTADDIYLDDVAVTSTRQWAVGSFAPDGVERPWIQHRCSG